MENHLIAIVLHLHPMPSVTPNQLYGIDAHGLACIKSIVNMLDAHGFSNHEFTLMLLHWQLALRSWQTLAMCMAPLGTTPAALPPDVALGQWLDDVLRVLSTHTERCEKITWSAIAK